MNDEPGFDLVSVGAEDFARLVGALNDEQLGGTIRAVGTAPVLDRIFVHMRERFRPEQAAGIEATAQFVIRDQGAEHAYWVGICGPLCVVSREQSAPPRVALRMELLPFVKLVTGWAAGPALFMKGQLVVSGDLPFALRLLGLFDRPNVA